MSDITIAPDRRVTLHFAIKLSDRTVIDSNFEKSPASFVMGDGNLLPGFEELLLGLKAGDQAEYTVAPEKAFGMPNPNNVQRLPRSQFAADMELSEGLVVSFADAGQTELPGVVTAVTDDQVEVDFNHPLAGRELLFAVKILNVE